MTLVRIGFIPIPAGAAPGFDHADIYTAANGQRRMVIAHTGADRLDVIDCITRTYLRAIPGLPGVAGVLIDGDLLFTSDRGSTRVSIFDCRSEALLGRIGVGARPNGLAYDPRRQRLFSFNLGDPVGEGCTASAVDVEGIEVVAELALPGRPRWASYDPATDLIYANIRDPASIVLIEPESATIVGAFDIPSPGPHGLWIDGDRLYCAADGGVLVVLHRDTGAVMDEVPLPGVPDVVMHDAETHKLYVAVGDPGTVTVIDTLAVEVEETVETEPGAHTTGWDPVAKTLYVFCPQSGGAAMYTEVAR